MAILILLFAVVIFIYGIFLLHHATGFRARLSRLHPAWLYVIVGLPILSTIYTFPSLTTPQRPALGLILVVCTIQVIAFLLAAECAMVLRSNRKWNGFFVGISVLVGSFYLAIPLVIATFG